MKSINHIQIMLPVKMPSPSSSLNSTRIKYLIPTLLKSCKLRVSRSFSKTRSFVARTIKEKLDRVHVEIVFPLINWDKKSKKKNAPFGSSFRFHYNWCSSSHICYYDATWDSMIPMEQLEGKRGDMPSLSGYLEWLEEEDHIHKNIGEGKQEYLNEIDKLADTFIAKNHEKFILEKQESYRRSLHEDIF